MAHASADLYYSDPRKDRKKGQDPESRSTDPIKSDVCVPRALWLALELRCDRVYHTVCRSILENIVQHSQHTKSSSQYIPENTQINQNNNVTYVPSYGGLSNLAIIGGDASDILPNRIAPSSITSVYVNHPEPPERTGGVGDSEGQHLLTQEFFSEIYRILIPTGTCTIVTDNLPYAKSLLQGLAKSNNSKNLMKNNEKQSDDKAINCFQSVKIDSNNDNKIILEEEIISGVNSALKTDSKSAKTLSNKSNNQKNKKNKGKKQNSSDTESENDDNDDDEEDDNGDQTDNFKYVNDEDSIISLDNVPLLKKEKNGANGQGLKNEKNSTQKAAENKIISPSITESEVQVLQLWRGDSAEVENNDNNNQNRKDGDSVHASSYFDRMWERGQKKRRWFMILKKSGS